MRDKPLKQVRRVRAKLSGNLPQTEEAPICSDLGPTERVLFALWESPNLRSSESTSIKGATDQDQA